MKPLLLFVGSIPSTTDLLTLLFSNRYRTLTCTTPAEALAYLDSTTDAERPSVVVCDQATPDDKTPIEVFRGMKNDEKNGLIPTILLLAEHDSTAPRRRLMELNWAEVQPKPFNPDGLALAFQRLLLRSH